MYNYHLYVRICPHFANVQMNVQLPAVHSAKTILMTIPMTTKLMKSSNDDDSDEDDSNYNDDESDEIV